MPILYRATASAASAACISICVTVCLICFVTALHSEWQMSCLLAFNSPVGVIPFQTNPKWYAQQQQTQIRTSNNIQNVIRNQSNYARMLEKGNRRFVCADAFLRFAAYLTWSIISWWLNDSLILVMNVTDDKQNVSLSTKCQRFLNRRNARLSSNKTERRMKCIHRVATGGHRINALLVKWTNTLTIRR